MRYPLLAGLTTYARHGRRLIEWLRMFQGNTKRWIGSKDCTYVLKEKEEKDSDEGGPHLLERVATAVAE